MSLAEECRPEYAEVVPSPESPLAESMPCDAALRCVFLVHGPGSNGDGGVTATCSSVFFRPNARTGIRYRNCPRTWSCPSGRYVHFLGFASPLQDSLGVETTTDALQHAYTTSRRAGVQYKPSHLTDFLLTPTKPSSDHGSLAPGTGRGYICQHTRPPSEPHTDNVIQLPKPLPRPTSPKRASADGHSSEMARLNCNSLPRQIPPSSKTRMRRGACGRRP